MKRLVALIGRPRAKPRAGSGMIRYHSGSKIGRIDGASDLLDQLHNLFAELRFKLRIDARHLLDKSALVGNEDLNLSLIGPDLGHPNVVYHDDALLIDRSLARRLQHRLLR